MSVWSEAVGTVWPGRDARDGPLPPLLLLLTVVTGLVDAASYLKLGHVFVANMTGNVVFLGFAIAGASGLSIWASLVALASSSSVGSPAAESAIASRRIAVNCSAPRSRRSSSLLLPRSAPPPRQEIPSPRAGGTR